jgi:hypothetical protein
MANNYDQATVQSNFPFSSVSEFEKELLNRYGFSCEIHGSNQCNTVYFFVEESISDEIDYIDVDYVFSHAKHGDPIAVKLLDYIQQHGSDNLDSYVSGEFNWQTIFQEILKKPECEGIEDICVMGAYTCDKLRAGEFGGWVCRITRESVQHDGTSAAFERMKKEPEFLAALDILLVMANGHILDQLDVDDDPELATEHKQQRHALNVVSDYLQNHNRTD